VQTAGSKDNLNLFVRGPYTVWCVAVRIWSVLLHCIMHSIARAIQSITVPSSSGIVLGYGPGLYTRNGRSGKVLRKCVSVFIICCFVLSDMGGYLTDHKAWADTKPVRVRPVIEEASFTFTLPENLGVIKDKWSPIQENGDDKKFVIHVQDAHCNYYTQHAVGEIMEYICKEYKVNLINLEGGKGVYDLSPFTRVTDSIAREKISDTFVEKGWINGTEYFAINNPESIDLWGVEDVQPYLKNLSVYKTAIGYQDTVKTYIDQLSYIINQLKQRMFSKKLLAIDKHIDSYKAGTINVREYIKHLIFKAEELGVDLSSYPQAERLRVTMDLEKGIDFKIATEQRDNLISLLEKKLSRRALEILVHKTILFKKEKLSAPGFYAYLFETARGFSINTSHFTELNEYYSYIDCYEGIGVSRAMDEFEELTTAIKGRLFNNEKEKKLDLLSRHLKLMKQMFDFRLTRKQYDYYKSNERLFSAEEYIAYIQDAAPAYGIIIKLPEDLAQLDTYRLHVSRFYEYSKKRDEVFLKNMKYSEYTDITKTKTKIAVLVTGGFHTDNLCKLFKEENIAYVSILPNFNESENYESQYFSMLTGNIADPVEQALDAVLSNMHIQIASVLCPAIRDAVWGRSNVSKMQAVLWVQGELASGRTVVIELEDGSILKFAGQYGNIVISDKAEEEDQILSVAEFLSAVGGVEVGIDDDMEEDSTDNDESNLEENYKQSGINMERTPVVLRDIVSEAVQQAAENGKKPIHEIRRELDEQVELRHEQMQNTYGFLPHDFSPEITKIYEIFERLVPAYNILAENQGQPKFKGKLFIVDSPDENAFVFSEHTDVYIFSGLIREMARYAYAKGVDFSEDLIAAVLSHEMTHILQQSSYEGLNYSTQDSNKYELQELLSMGQNAEFDADEGAIPLLSLAGYSPQGIATVMEYLTCITPISTAETINIHPHPKLRLANIELYFDNPRNVMTSWDVPFKKLDTESYMRLVTGHHTPDYQDSLSVDDLKGLMDKAKTLPEMVEIARIIRERYELAQIRYAANLKQMRDKFAKETFVINLMIMAREIHRTYLKKKEGSKVETKPPVEGRLLPSQKGAYIHDEVGDDDAGLLENPETGHFDRSHLKQLLERTGSIKPIRRNFQERMEVIVNRVMKDEALDGEEKKEIIGYFKILKSLFDKNIDSITDAAYESSFGSENVDMEELSGRVCSSNDTGHIEDTLSILSRVPVSTYQAFNADTLDRQYEVSDGKVKIVMIGIGENVPDDKKPEVTIKREIEDSGLYRRNVRFLRTDTEDERRNAYNIVRYSWAINEYKARDSADVSNSVFARFGTTNPGNMREQHPAGFFAQYYHKIMDIAPDLPAELADPDRPYDQQNKRVKQLLAQIFMRPNYLIRKKQDRMLFSDYLIAVLPHEIEKLRSSTFESENGLDTPDELKLNTAVETSTIHGETEDERTAERQKNRARSIEYSGDKKQAAKILVYFLKDAKNADDFRRILSESLFGYSRIFKREIIKELLSGHYLIKEKSEYAGRPDTYEKGVEDEKGNILIGKYFPPHKELFSIIEDELSSFADAHQLLEQYIRKRGYSKLWTIEEGKAYLTFLEWFLDKYNDSEVVPDWLGNRYMEAYFKVHDGETYTVQDTYEVLSRLSKKLWLDYELRQSFKFIDEDADGETDLIKGVIKKQQFFRNIMDLELEQLQEIASNQMVLKGETRNEREYRKGKVKIDTTLSTRFSELMNALIIVKIIERADPERVPVSSGHFLSILSGLLSSDALAGLSARLVEAMQKDEPLYMVIDDEKEDEEQEDADTEKKEDNLVDWSDTQKSPPFQVRVEIVKYKELAGLVRQHYKEKSTTEIEEFFAMLSRGFMTVNPVGQAPAYTGVSAQDKDEGASDMFFAYLGEDDTFLSCLPKYADLMGDPQIPARPDLGTLLSTREERQTYLEAFADRVDIFGEKVRLFSQYCPDLELVQVTHETVDRKCASLTRILRRHTLFRDGFIDVWERQLFEEMHSGSKLKIKDFESNLGKHSGAKRRRGIFSRLLPESKRARNFSIISDFFKRSLIEPHLEWYHLRRLDFTKIPSKRRKELLNFYKTIIGLIFDPQRKVRFGATALKLFRTEYPDATFQEELAAIKQYLPDASEIRDEELDKLFENHIVPSLTIPKELVSEVRKLYSEYQKLEFNEELTNMNAVYQAVRQILSAFSRADKKDFFLWLVDDKKYPMPKALRRIDDKSNIEFADLPYHARYVPAPVRRQILNFILTGENGLLNVRTKDDEKVKREFADKVFDHYFPGDANNPKKSGIDKDVLPLIKEIFIIAVLEYNQARGTSIIQDLVNLEENLKELSFGERLVTLLAGMGPVGVKVGQYLSENQQLVKNQRLRSQLGSLKDNAKPFNKIAVIDSLIAAGYSMDEFRVGKRLGSASIKQVHAGELRLPDGKWRPVVFKVLRPAINRTIQQDLRVLDKVLDFLKKEKDMDTGDLSEAIRGWLEEEMNFSKEAENNVIMQDVINSYGDLPEDSPFRYKGSYETIEVMTPEVCNVEGKNTRSVMVEGKVQGIEVGKLVGSSGILSIGAEQKRITRRELLDRGLSEKDADYLLNLNIRVLKDLVRKHFLYQMFEHGTFHADLHASNVMVGRKGLYFIDMGLIGKFKNGQKDAAKEFIKGILLRSPERILSGVQGILRAEGGGIDDPAVIANMTELIRKAVRRNWSNTLALINDIGTIVVQANKGPGGETFSVFLKAFTQAIWLFPDSGLEAFDSIEGLKAATNMTQDEYNSIKRAQMLPWTGRTTEKVLSRPVHLIGGCFTLARTAVTGTLSVLSRIRRYGRAHKFVDALDQKKDAKREKKHESVRRLRPIEKWERIWYRRITSFLRWWIEHGPILWIRTRMDNIPEIKNGKVAEKTDLEEDISLTPQLSPIIGLDQTILDEPDEETTDEVKKSEQGFINTTILWIWRAWQTSKWRFGRRKGKIEPQYKLPDEYRTTEIRHITVTETGRIVGTNLSEGLLSRMLVDMNMPHDILPEYLEKAYTLYAQFYGLLAQSPAQLLGATLGVNIPKEEYLRIERMIRMTENYGTVVDEARKKSEKETTLLQFAALHEASHFQNAFQKQAAGDHLTDLLSRALANRILAMTSGNRKQYDVLSYNNPILRSYGDMLLDRYLEELDARDIVSPINDKATGKLVSRRDILFSFYGNMSLKSFSDSDQQTEGSQGYTWGGGKIKIKADDAPLGVEIRMPVGERPLCGIRYGTRERGRVPSDFLSKPFRKKIADLDISQPGVQKQVLYRDMPAYIKRIGYADGGRIEMTIDSIVHGKSVFFKFTDRSYKYFIQTGSPDEVIVTSYGIRAGQIDETLSEEVVKALSERGRWEKEIENRLRTLVGFFVEFKGEKFEEVMRYVRYIGVDKAPDCIRLHDSLSALFLLRKRFAFMHQTNMEYDEIIKVLDFQIAQKDRQLLLEQGIDADKRDSADRLYKERTLGDMEYAMTYMLRQYRSSQFYDYLINRVLSSWWDAELAGAIYKHALEQKEQKKETSSYSGRAELDVEAFIRKESTPFTDTSHTARKETLISDEILTLLERIVHSVPEINETIRRELELMFASFDPAVLEQVTGVKIPRLLRLYLSAGGRFSTILPVLEQLIVSGDEPTRQVVLESLYGMLGSAKGDVSLSTFGQQFKGKTKLRIAQLLDNNWEDFFVDPALSKTIHLSNSDKKNIMLIIEKLLKKKFQDPDWEKGKGPLNYVVNILWNIFQPLEVDQVDGELDVRKIMEIAVSRGILERDEPLVIAASEIEKIFSLLESYLTGGTNMGLRSQAQMFSITQTANESGVTITRLLVKMAEHPGLRKRAIQTLTTVFRPIDDFTDEKDLVWCLAAKALADIAKHNPEEILEILRGILARKGLAVLPWVIQDAIDAIEKKQEFTPNMAGYHRYMKVRKALYTGNLKDIEHISHKNIRIYREALKDHDDVIRDRTIRVIIRVFDTTKGRNAKVLLKTLVSGSDTAYSEARDHMPAILKAYLEQREPVFLKTLIEDPEFAAISEVIKTAVAAKSDKAEVSAEESPIGLSDGGAIAQLTKRGIEFRDDITVSEETRKWNIRHEEWHLWAGEHTELSKEEREVFSIIMAYHNAVPDNHLSVLLAQLHAGLNIPENSTIDLAKISEDDIQLMIQGAIQYLSSTRPGYAEVFGSDGVEADIYEAIQAALAKRVEPEAVPVVSVKEELYKEAQALIPELISVINRGAPTYDIAPASFEGKSKVMNLLRRAERTMGRKAHTINARFYSFEGKEDDESWYEGLKQELTEMLPSFNQDAVTNDATRLTIRVLDRGKSMTREMRRADLRAFLVAELTKLNNNRVLSEKIVNEKILIIDEHVQDAEHLNSVIDLFVDIGIMEMDRYNKVKEGAYKMDIPYDCKAHLAELLRLSVTNLEDVTPENLISKLNLILSGDTVLMIKAINWETLRKWKESNDAVLMAL